MMKKAVIVTWFSSCNFGQVLQAYAMQQIVEKTGFSSRLLTYNPECKKKGWMAYYIGNHMCEANRGHFLKTLFFEGFVLRYLRITKPCRSMEEVCDVLRRERPAACFCGSDQIWNPKCYDPVYYLDFNRDFNMKKIAYAPSIINREQLQYYDRTLERMKKSLGQIDCLSARERTGCELVYDLTGRMPEHVLDPTLMLPKSYWVRRMHLRKKQRKYILCYFIGDGKIYADCLEEIRKRYGIDDLVFIGEADIGPRKFLSLLYNAELVCTDSFHGAAFSVNFEKQFFAFRRQVRGVRGRGKDFHNFDRIDNLAELMDIKERIITNVVEDIRDIDYNIVRKRLHEQRKRSWNYLKSSVKEIKV